MADTIAHVKTDRLRDSLDNGRTKTRDAIGRAKECSKRCA